jgi:hypothetical protein
MAATTASPRKSESSLDLTRPIKRWTDANVGYAVSLADAASRGLGKFGESVTEANLARLDFSNGFLRGAVAGWGVAMEELPKAVTRFYDVLLDRPSATPKKTARRTKGKRR